MKAPAFWSNPPDRVGWQARVLSPAAAIWCAATRRRFQKATPVRAGAPVLCIGNLTAGGTGKTPMVAALMTRLASHGIAAHVVSRGYGGRIEGPHLVDPLEDTPSDVGDEPLMLAARGLVWVAKDRIAGARAAVAGGAKLILLDDGFQNPGLHKDAAILMIDAGAGFGNGYVIPAGPLREPVEGGLSRADLAVLIGTDTETASLRARWPILQTARTLDARLVPLQTGFPLTGEPVVAFAGIGRPAKFFATLHEMGAKIVGTHSFPDHHAYAPAIIRRLISEARGQDALLVTTEKDAVRLPSSLRAEVLTVQVALEPADWGPVDLLIDRLLDTSAIQD